MKCTLYVDYSVDGVTGVGAYAALYDETYETASGFSYETNGKLMMLAAIYEGLMLTPEGSDVVLHTTSRALQHTLLSLGKWEKDGWEDADGPVPYADLCQQAYALLKKRYSLDIRLDPWENPMCSDLVEEGLRNGDNNAWLKSSTAR